MTPIQTVQEAPRPFTIVARQGVFTVQVRRESCPFVTSPNYVATYEGVTHIGRGGSEHLAAQTLASRMGWEVEHLYGPTQTPDPRLLDTHQFAPELLALFEQARRQAVLDDQPDRDVETRAFAQGQQIAFRVCEDYVRRRADPSTTSA